MSLLQSSKALWKSLCSRRSYGLLPLRLLCSRRTLAYRKHSSPGFIRADLYVRTQEHNLPLFHLPEHRFVWKYYTIDKLHLYVWKYNYHTLSNGLRCSGRQKIHPCAAYAVRKVPKSRSALLDLCLILCIIVSIFAAADRYLLLSQLLNASSQCSSGYKKQSLQIFAVNGSFFSHMVIPEENLYQYSFVHLFTFLMRFCLMRRSLHAL